MSTLNFLNDTLTGAGAAGYGAYQASRLGMRGLWEGAKRFPFSAPFVGGLYSLGGHYTWAKEPFGYSHGIGNFFRRGPIGHLARGAGNLGMASMWPFDIALSTGLSLAATEDMNMLSVQHGFTREMVSNLAAGPGFVAGGALGAAIGSILPIPGATLMGFMLGGFAGGMVGEVPFRIADMGEDRRFKQKTFVDSPQAFTMRQRSMQLINNSHVGGRSILGKEAQCYHL